MSRVAIYARYSSVPTDDQTTKRKSKATLRQAKVKSWTSVDMFTDMIRRSRQGTPTDVQRVKEKGPYNE